MLDLFFAVAREDVVNSFFLFSRVGSKQAYDGNNDEGDRHCGNAHFRGLGCGNVKTRCEGDHKCCAANGQQAGKNTCVCADLGDPFGEQPPNVRADEAARNNPPREGHKADDDRDVSCRKNKGAGDEGQTKNSGKKHLLLCGDFLFAYGGNQINRNCGGRGQNDCLQCGHGCGEKKDHDESKKDDAECTVAENLHQNGGDNGVDTALGKLAIKNQTGGTTDQICAAADYATEDGGDDRTALDCCGVLHGIELADHLGESPSTEAGQHDIEAEKPEGRAAENIGELRSRDGIGITGERREGGQVLDESGNAADFIMRQHGNYQTNHADNHNDALDQIRICCCDVAACNEVYRCQARDNEHPNPCINARKNGAEQRAESLVNGCGVGNEENKDDGRCQDLHPFGGVSLFKIVRHRSCIELFGHLSCFVCEQKPRK